MDKRQLTPESNPSKYLGNELDYIAKVLNSESWSSTGGSWNNALEQAFCEKFGVKYAIAMNSGTATLHCALMACGVGPGDEVITPALTVIMDSTATIHAGATPVYADINPKTFLMDPKDIKRKLTSRTKAIITVSLYGLPPAIGPILDIAKEYELAVIEDNAQCITARLDGDMASYSFENTKHISCGEGGMLTTNDEAKAEMARKLGGHGYKNLRAEEGRVRLNQDVFQNPHYKRHDVIGWNYRLNEFSAAIALAQLERIDELVDMRVQSANIFQGVMESCDYLIPQLAPLSMSSRHSYYTLAAVYEGEERIGVSWFDFRKRYMDNGGDGIYGAWSVPYQEPVLAGRYRGDCPVAESLQPKLMHFKTNYRSMDLALEKAAALGKTIKGYR